MMIPVKVNTKSDVGLQAFLAVFQRRHHLAAGSHLASPFSQLLRALQAEAAMV